VNLETRRKVTFPRYGDYNCVLKYVLEQGLNVQYILPPPLTRRTEELGAKYCPEFVCTPFKTLVGGMIEGLEAGADTLLMTHGFCRLGYFGEPMAQILRDLGYEFEMINLSEYNTRKKGDWLKIIKRLDSKVNLPRLIVALRDSGKMLEQLDEVISIYYRICGFDTSGNGCKQAYRRFISRLYTAASRSEIDAACHQVKADFEALPLKKPDHPLRVGIVGELYTVMDPFSNLEVEEKLSQMGVEVHRWMNLSHRLIHYPGEKNLNVKIRNYCTYEMGPTSTANIWCAKEYAEKGFDGLIHVKSANCTPEIDILPVLQNISADYKLPLLCLSYDTQTSDVGVMTRLEAFYDMLRAKRRKLV